MQTLTIRLPKCEWKMTDNLHNKSILRHDWIRLIYTNNRFFLPAIVKSYFSVES